MNIHIFYYYISLNIINFIKCDITIRQHYDQQICSNKTNLPLQCDHQVMYIHIFQLLK